MRLNNRLTRLVVAMLLVTGISSQIPGNNTVLACDYDANDGCGVVGSGGSNSRTAENFALAAGLIIIGVVVWKSGDHSGSGDTPPSDVTPLIIPPAGDDKKNEQTSLSTS